MADKLADGADVAIDPALCACRRAQRAADRAFPAPPAATEDDDDELEPAADRRLGVRVTALVVVLCRAAWSTAWSRWSATPRRMPHRTLNRSPPRPDELLGKQFARSRSTTIPPTPARPTSRRRRRVNRPCARRSCHRLRRAVLPGQPRRWRTAWRCRCVHLLRPAARCAARAPRVGCRSVAVAARCLMVDSISVHRPRARSIGVRALSFIGRAEVRRRIR